MYQEKKLKIEDLEVESFVTILKEEKENELKGGSTGCVEANLWPD